MGKIAKVARNIGMPPECGIVRRGPTARAGNGPGKNAREKRHKQGSDPGPIEARVIRHHLMQKHKVYRATAGSNGLTRSDIGHQVKNVDQDGPAVVSAMRNNAASSAARKMAPWDVSGDPGDSEIFQHAQQYPLDDLGPVVEAGNDPASNAAQASGGDHMRDRLLPRVRRFPGSTLADGSTRGNRFHSSFPF